MTLSPVLLAYTKDFPKTSTTTPGDETTVTANVILLIDEATRDYFNIPKAPDNSYSAMVRQVIKEYTYKRFRDLKDTTGTTITVPEYERGGRAAKSVGNVVRLATKLETGKKKPRTGSIRFPGFFNIIMISQAIGSMIKANEPNSFRLDKTGKSYPLVLNTSAGVMTGYQSGAWLVSAPITPTNTDDTSAVGDTTIVTGKNKASG